MRILYAHLYDGRFKIGGAERVLYDIALAMKETYGHDVVCAVIPGNLSAMLTGKGIRTFSLPWSKLKSFETLGQLRKILGDFQPDLVHSHHRYTTFLLDVFLKSKTRILHTEHVLRKNKRLFFRYGHMATAVHESVRENLIRYFNVPEDKVITIPNAVKIPEPDREKLSRFAERIELSDQRTRVLFIGRFDEQKGHIYLIRAVQRLSEKYRRRLQILLAGDGPLEGMVRKKVSEWGLQGCFEFLGHTQEIPELLNLSHFLILPSLWEGMPLSVLEAYAAGKAVLATDIPGTRELIKAGKTGELVPARNDRELARALEKWMDSPERVQKMGEEAKRIADSEFSYRVMTDRYLKAYQSLIAQIP